MSYGTQFTETEALLHALDDAAADSGNTELTELYLQENFLPGELRKLQSAAELLSECIDKVARERGGYH